jgi:hypothetical protein
MRQVEEIAVVVGEVEPHQTNFFLAGALRHCDAALDCLRIMIQFAHVRYLTSALGPVGKPAYNMDQLAIAALELLRTGRPAEMAQSVNSNYDAFVVERHQG